MLDRENRGLGRLLLVFFGLPILQHGQKSGPQQLHITPRHPEPKFFPLTSHRVQPKNQTVFLRHKGDLHLMELTHGKLVAEPSRF